MTCSQIQHRRSKCLSISHNLFCADHRYFVPSKDLKMYQQYYWLFSAVPADLPSAALSSLSSHQDVNCAFRPASGAAFSVSAAVSLKAMNIYPPHFPHHPASHSNFSRCCRQYPLTLLMLPATPWTDQENPAPVLK